MWDLMNFQLQDSTRNEQLMKQMKIDVLRRRVAHFVRETNFLFNMCSSYAKHKP